MWVFSRVVAASIGAILVLVSTTLVTGFMALEDLSYVEPQILIGTDALCVRYNASLLNEIMDAMNNSQIHFTGDLACMSIDASAVVLYSFMLGWSAVALFAPCISVLAVLSLIGT